jgi:hypothetical protein
VFTYALPSTGNCASSFYVVTATLPSGLLPTEDEGAYGLVVPVSGLLAGGFDLGGGFGPNAGTPGYGNFKPAASTQITIGITAAATSGANYAQQLMVTVYQNTSTGPLLYSTTQYPPFSFTPPITFAANTFYTIQLNSLANAPEGSYTMQLQTAGGNGGFTGGVATGGKAIQGVPGYGGFCLPSAQSVPVDLQIGSVFGIYGAGNLNVVMKNSSTGQTFSPQ